MNPQTLLRRLFAVATLIAVSGWAMATFAATIEGRVVDIDGQPIAGVMVTATHLETAFGGVAVTDKSGQFTVDELPVGRYRVVAERAGYLLRALTVALDRETIAPLRLSMAPALGGQPSTLNEPRPKNYATTSILYGTDRRPSAAPGTSVAFGVERGDLVVGVCEVSVPLDHRVGDLEAPRLWKLEFRPDPSKHIVLLSTSRLDPQSFRKLLQQRLTQAKVRSGLVFIHGFNVSFEDAAQRTAQLAKDLDFDGVPSFYSWASNGKVVDYAADGEQARRAVPYLRDYLKLVFADPQLDEVHLIAHSMGNRVLTAALQQLAAERPASARPKLGQIALVAPDIDAEVFRTQIAPQIVGVGRRLTLYGSTRDKALLASKKVHNYPRAGDLSDTVTIVNGMDTIDASAVDTSFVGHSYFGDNRSVISDLFVLLQRNATPSERFGMRPMTSSGLRYWKFAP
jgi:esterase/lipase superfamily enzyme